MPKKVKGIKYDQDKNRVDLLNVPALLEIGKVLTFGARKYTPENWKLVDDLYRRYYGALLRHMFAWWGGEKYDPETGLTHLAHAGACILFLLGAELESIQVENTPVSKDKKKKTKVKSLGKAKRRSNKHTRKRS